MTHPRRPCIAGLTLVEVLIAVMIFAIAVFAILELVNQNLQLVRMMQQQRPDLGALADRTLTEPAEAANGTLRVQRGDSPTDIDFGGNDGGGAGALYPNASWWRDIEPLDETNGLYRVTIHVEETIAGENREIILKYLMFRPDVAEAESGGAQTK
ncbi:MAG: prepilin-type N-terminal cleavage/methylation domain-containing protein [Verrucomicrobia subdivision 3 bacterium]|nr:prepilin-type N-terminal cleavage/methylation domain-containing protein [Limisphaerales bacterium]